jgi:hypothetical protein
MVNVRDEDRVRSPFTKGRLLDIVSYFHENPGRDITIGQLEKAFKGKWDRHGIMASMNHIISGRKDRPNVRNNIVKVTTGVWRLPLREAQTVDERPKHSVQDTSVSPHPLDSRESSKLKLKLDVLRVTVIKECDGEMVVVDDSTNIYRMVKVG